MKTTKEFRKMLVIASAVFICGVSLIGMIYIAYMQPEEYINPGIVTSASPVAQPIQSIRPSALLRTNSAYQAPSQSSSSFHAQMPSASMPTTKGLWATSSEKVHSVGGGMGGSYGAATNTQSSSSRGINYSGAGNVTMPLTTFVAVASMREVAPPAAQRAPSMAKLAVEPHRAPPPPPNPGGDELPGEHQLTEQPVGTPWVLAFFALIYTISVYLSRRRRENDTK